MNLADPKRLSVPGLEGLARLLELLTNYFKVEIGHKLLDHFRIVADQMLHDPTQPSFNSREDITKLVRLANIFHLLPSAANIFLDNLVNAIVQTESQMHFSTRSPFSEPLAKYLDRYPIEGIDFFVRHLNFPRHLRTFRSIFQAKLAPNLERELTSRTSFIVTNFLRGTDISLVLPAMLVFQDIVRLNPTWIEENDYVLDALLEIWYAGAHLPEESAIIIPDEIQRHTLMLDIFVQALNHSPRIDLLFDIVSIFTRNLGMDLIRTIHFLYHHVALSEDVRFRRNILMRFLTWFDSPSHSWSHKAYFIRYIISPTLLVHANRPAPKEQLLDLDFISGVHRIIWHRIPDTEAFSEADDMFKIEALHLTTIMVQHYPTFLENVKKDIIKCAWHYVTATDDIIVKQAAYLLAAHFYAAFPSPQKFILRAWTGLLRSPHSEGRALVRQEALGILAPSLPGSEAGELGHPQWAKTTRRLLAEEGIGQLIAIYQLIVKQPQLFYPVRSLFIPHMANSLNKLGMSSTSTFESRMLSIDTLQVIFTWEEQANRSLRSSTASTTESTKSEGIWLTPLAFRENMVSYLVRLATTHHEQSTRGAVLPRALSLLQTLVGPNGWTDVTVGLRFFSRLLENVRRPFVSLRLTD
jgi:transformation/transcription domain-associated protein